MCEPSIDLPTRLLSVAERRELAAYYRHLHEMYGRYSHQLEMTALILEQHHDVPLDQLQNPQPPRHLSVRE